MKKKLIIPVVLAGILMVSGALAAVFYFNTFSFLFNISEPLTVKYYVTEVGTCAASPSPYTNTVTTDTVDLETLIGTIYPGDDGRVCFMVSNDAEEDMPFSAVFTDESATPGLLSSSVLTFGGIVPDFAFGVPGRLYGDFFYKVADNADGTFEGKIDFGRGTA